MLVAVLCQVIKFPLTQEKDGSLIKNRRHQVCRSGCRLGGREMAHGIYLFPWLGGFLPSALHAESWRQAHLTAKPSYVCNSSGVFKVGGSQKPCRQIPPRWQRDSSLCLREVVGAERVMGAVASILIEKPDFSNSISILPGTEPTVLWGFTQ